MMKKQLNFLFATIEGGGNIPPVLGVARRLLERGHRVRVLTEPCLETVIRNHGLEFIPFREHFTRTDRQEDFIRDWNASPFSDPAIENVVFGPARITAAETLEALGQFHADVLVADCLLPAALIAAEVKQIPSAILFHMPEYMPGPNRPPGVMGLLPGKGLFGRWRDRLLGGLFHRILNKYLPPVNVVRTAHGLEKLNRAADLLDRADRRLIQTLRSFDFPVEPSPANVRYTGPVLDDPDWAVPWQSPWPAEDARPLVVVSLSSTFQNQAAVIQRCIDALGALPVRGLVTLGLALDREKFRMPENVVVVGSAPHSQVFPLADLVITHAGHGTIMRALANGLPLICLPMGRDQKDNAVKVAYHGCGLKLSPRAKVGAIRRAITQVLADQKFRKNAVGLQREIRLEAEQNTAVAELEQLGIGKEFEEIKDLADRA